MNGGPTHLSVALAIGLTCVLCDAVMVVAQRGRARVGVIRARHGPVAPTSADV